MVKNYEVSDVDLDLTKYYKKEIEIALINDNPITFIKKVDDNYYIIEDNLEISLTKEQYEKMKAKIIAGPINKSVYILTGYPCDMILTMLDGDLKYLSYVTVNFKPNSDIMYFKKPKWIVNEIEEKDKIMYEDISLCYAINIIKEEKKKKLEK